jgi:hypothetical protein
VERDNNDLIYIGELCAALVTESVTEIDFDRLRVWLTELGGVLPALYLAREEAEVLREDVKGRIGGMLKAIAIAERGKSAVDDALDIIDHLPDKSATELIGLYRRTQARFRDTFPAGFGTIMPRRAPSQNEGRTTKRV